MTNKKNIVEINKNNNEAEEVKHSWLYNNKILNVDTGTFVRLINNALDYTLKENRILIDELEKKGVQEKEIVDLLQPNVDKFNNSQKEILEKVE